MMKKKQRGMLFCSICLVLVLAAMPLIGACAAPAPAPKMALRFASVHPDMALVSRTLYTKFMESVTEKSNGRITFDCYWASSLVKSGELLEATSKNVVDIATGLWIFEPGTVPLGSFEMNFVFNDPDSVVQAKVKREMFERIPAFNEELINANLAPNVLFGTNPPMDILSKTPIRTIEDLKGLRIGHSPVEHVPAFEAIGAVSVISPAPEFYERLERGTLDAIFLPNLIMDIYKNQEVAPYYTVVSFNTPVTFGLWINLDMWNSLTPEDQQIFRDAGLEAEDNYLPAMGAAIEKLTKDWTEQGVTFYTMPQAEVQKWADAMPDLAADWAAKMEAKGLPGSEIVSMYRELGGTQH